MKRRKSTRKSFVKRRKAALDRIGIKMSNRLMQLLPKMSMTDALKDPQIVRIRKATDKLVRAKE